jgi:hypothetical protein
VNVISGHPRYPHKREKKIILQFISLVITSHYLTQYFFSNQGIGDKQTARQFPAMIAQAPPVDMRHATIAGGNTRAAHAPPAWRKEENNE